MNGPYRPVLAGLALVCLITSLGVQAAGRGLPGPLYATLERARILLRDERPDQALKLLARAERQARGDDARAVVLQTRGYAEMDLERLSAAARSFQAALELDALPAEHRANLRYNLASLLARLGRPREAIRRLERALDLAGEAPVDPDVRLLLARLYIEVERYSKVPPLLKGMAREFRAAKDRERVYRLLVVAHSASGHYAAAVTVLESLLSDFPRRKEYWLRLADGYLSLGREARALAALEAAHGQGLLERGGELRSLAGLHLRQGIPYRGAEVLERGLNDGRLDPSIETLRMLVQAWGMARERDREIGALERLVSRFPGESRAAIRLARLFLQADAPERALEVIDPALLRTAEASDADHGDAGVRDELWLLKGRAYIRNGAIGSGREAFARIDGDSPRAGQARQWLAYLDYVSAGR